MKGSDGMNVYYIHKHLNYALKISYDQYSIIQFESDGTYSITISKGEFDKSKLEHYIGISREDLMVTIQGKAYDSLMEQSIHLEEQLLKNKKRILNLSRLEYDNI